jgi:outer membrane immunogenic protein
MKKLSIVLASLAAFVSAPAIAADMPAKARPMPVVAPAPYNWSGFYIGFSSGGSIADVSWDISPGAGGDPDHIADGGVIGGTIGFNWQVGQWVFGVEGDGSYANIKGANNCGFLGNFRCRSEIEAIGTIRGRLGYAVGPMLWYATAGGAFANFEASIRELITGATIVEDQGVAGWTGGFGFEYSPFRNNLSWKIEWLYYEFDRETFFPVTGGPGGGLFAGGVSDIKHRGHIVRTGLNYRFSWTPPVAPVVARY